MAKKKPPAKKKPTKAPPKKPPVKKPQPVDLTSLETPNHLVAKVADARALWPLMTLRKIGGERDEFLFVSPRYAGHAWPDACEHPPTWMDPEMFIFIVQHNKTVLELIEKAQKLGTKAPATQLATLLEMLFDRVYLPGILKMFMDGCGAALADWLIANRAYELSDPQKPQKKGTRRGKNSS